MNMNHLSKRLFGAAAIGLSLLATTPSHAALVGLWNFEGTVNDVSGNGNNGTASAAPTFVNDAPVGGGTSSLSFAGGLHVIVANEQNFDFGNNMTVSTWVKGGLPGTWDPFISKNGEPNGWQLRRHSNTERIDFTTRRSPDNGQTDFASTDNAAGKVISTDPGNWHHIVGTFDGVTKRIYIDGVLNNSVNVAAGAIIDSPASVIFGGRQNPGPGVANTSFEGQLDNVAIYNTALSGQEIALLAMGQNPAALDTSILPEGGWNSKTYKRPGNANISDGGSGNGFGGSGSVLDALNNGTVIGSGFVNVVNYADSDNAGGNGDFLGDVNPFGLAAGDDQHFVVESTGFLQVGKSGNFQFRVNNDDGSRLRVDLNSNGTFDAGETIIFDDVLSGEHNVDSAIIALNIGQYMIEHIWYERDGGAEGELSLSYNNSSFTLFGNARSNDGAGAYALAGVYVTQTKIIPEPATLSLLGLAGLGLMRRRRRLA